MAENKTKTINISNENSIIHQTVWEICDVREFHSTGYGYIYFQERCLDCGKIVRRARVEAEFFI